MKPIIVIGSSSFGRLVRLLVEEVGRSFGGFVDDISKGDQVLGTLAQLGEQLLPSDYDVAMGIGYRNLDARWDVFLRGVDAGFSFPPLVHPRAVVSPQASIGEGCILMAGCNVDAFTNIDAGCVLWPGSVVSHDSHIGHNSFISPNATICGFVSVGSSSFIGAGSVLVDGANLPDRSFVRAASRSGGRSSHVGM